MASNLRERREAISIEQLMADFGTEKLSIEADWNEWLKKTSYQLLK
jgi:hypothetical protein